VLVSRQEVGVLVVVVVVGGGVVGGCDQEVAGGTDGLCPRPSSQIINSRLTAKSSTIISERNRNSNRRYAD
jgi:hypothetical protein